MLVVLVAAAAVGWTGLPPLPSQGLECIVMNEQNPATRPSPLDSVTFSVGEASVKVCYGRPSAKGRTMLGGRSVPYGEMWRTGANEPSMIHTSGPLNVAGIAIPAGSYSIYTVPDDGDWLVVLNRSISQWGHERFYTGDVAAMEVGRAPVESRRLEEHTEMFTMRTDGSGESVTLLLEWEHTRVAIPIRGG